MNIKKQPKRVIFWGLVIPTLLLQGCISTNSDTFVDNRVLDRWALNGKIGLVYPQAHCQGSDCRKRSDQGGISWQQQRSDYDITITDPFGRTVLTVSGNPQQLRAQSPGENPLVVAPKEFLALLAKDSTQRSILSELSPDDLRYWVTGRVNPAYPVEKKQDTFEQKGFSISARQWRTTPAGNVPALVTVKKDDFTLRLVVREWSALAQ